MALGRVNHSLHSLVLEEFAAVLRAGAGQSMPYSSVAHVFAGKLKAFLIDVLDGHYARASSGGGQNDCTDN